MLLESLECAFPRACKHDFRSWTRRDHRERRNSQSGIDRGTLVIRVAGRPYVACTPGSGHSTAAIFTSHGDIARSDTALINDEAHTENRVATDVCGPSLHSSTRALRVAVRVPRVMRISRVER